MHHSSFVRNPSSQSSVVSSPQQQNVGCDEVQVQVLHLETQVAGHVAEGVGDKGKEGH